MSIEESSFQLKDENLDRADASVQSAIEDGYDVHNISFEGPSIERAAALQNAFFSVFPELRGKYKFPERFTQYQATIGKATPDLQSGQEVDDSAFIVLPGSYGTAPTDWTIVEAFRQELKNKIGKRISWGAALSGTLSHDTIDQPYIHNPLDRSMDAAALIQRLVIENPVRDITLLANSIGAYDVGVAAVTLNQAFKDMGVDTRIRKIIELSPGGKGEVGAVKFAFKAATMGTKGETRQQFPTLEDVLKKKQELDEATERGDEWEIWRKDRQMNMVTQNYVFPDVPETEQQTLRDVNKVLEADGSAFDIPLKKNKMQARKIRETITNNRMQQKFIGPDARPLKAPLELHRRAARATFLRSSDRITSIAPEYVRIKNDIPTAVIAGKNDPLFPADKLSEDIGAIYPNSPITVRVAIDDWPHATHITDSGQLAEIGVATMGRMDAAEEYARENPDVGQINLRSHY